jgi:hypothetical protein
LVVAEVGATLLDMEAHDTVDVNAGDDTQNDARVAIIDGVDDGIAAGQNRCAACRDGNLVTDLENGGLIVDNDQRRVGKHLDARDCVQNVED